MIKQYEEIERIRELNNPNHIIPQKGAQENNLNLDVDILITGGNRGGGKSFMLCMEAKYDTDKPDFYGVIFRKEKGDLEGIIKTSRILFDQEGEYKKADNAMCWDFYNGGKLRFSYFDQSYSEFVDRFQGQQIAYIGIDEITQMPYDKFKYLITTNRNASGITNRIWGTCNPDPYSWVRRFIDWWIGEDGYPIPERDGVVRYCFMDGSNPDDIYWGNSTQEVYSQCANIIDKAYEISRIGERGYGKEVFIKRVTFTKASLHENIKLLESDPSYVASISGDEDSRQRNLYGNWNYKPTTSDIIKPHHIENMFTNSHQTGDNIRRITCDVAFDGGDALVMWLWIGRHIKDVFVCSLNSKDTVNVVSAKCREWQVTEDKFMYDLQGVGQIFAGFMPEAIGFNAQGAVDKEEKLLYANLKSKCAYMFSKSLSEKNISIEENLRDKILSGRNFASRTLISILLEERKVVQFVDLSVKGKEIIDKEAMKRIIGRSPDYIESLLMREYFDFLESDEWVRPTGLGYI